MRSCISCTCACRRPGSLYPAAFRWNSGGFEAIVNNCVFHEGVTRGLQVVEITVRALTLRSVGAIVQVALVQAYTIFGEPLKGDFFGVYLSLLETDECHAATSIESDRERILDGGLLDVRCQVPELCAGWLIRGHDSDVGPNDPQIRIPVHLEFNVQCFLPVFNDLEIVHVSMSPLNACAYVSSDVVFLYRVVSTCPMDILYGTPNATILWCSIGFTHHP